MTLCFWANFNRAGVGPCWSVLVRAGPPGILLADLKEKYEAFTQRQLDYDALGFKILWELLEYWKDFVKITQEVSDCDVRTAVQCPCKKISG